MLIVEDELKMASLLRRGADSLPADDAAERVIDQTARALSQGDGSPDDLGRAASASVAEALASYVAVPDTLPKAAVPGCGAMAVRSHCRTAQNWLAAKPAASMMRAQDLRDGQGRNRGDGKEHARGWARSGDPGGRRLPAFRSP